MACNSRNPSPATIFNNREQAINVYGDDVEVDYRNYDVTVESFIRYISQLCHAVPLLASFTTAVESFLVVNLIVFRS